MFDLFGVIETETTGHVRIATVDVFRRVDTGAGGEYNGTFEVFSVAKTAAPKYVKPDTFVEFNVIGTTTVDDKTTIVSVVDTAKLIDLSVEISKYSGGNRTTAFIDVGTAIYLVSSRPYTTAAINNRRSAFDFFGCTYGCVSTKRRTTPSTKR